MIFDRRTYFRGQGKRSFAFKSEKKSRKKIIRRKICAIHFCSCGIKFYCLVYVFGACLIYKFGKKRKQFQYGAFFFGGCFGCLYICLAFCLDSDEDSKNVKFRNVK